MVNPGPAYPGPGVPPPYYPAPPPPAPQRNWVPITLAIVGGLLVLCCGGGTAAAVLIARNADKPVPVTVGVTPEPTRTRTTESTPSPAATPSKAGPLPADAVYEGRGDKVVKLKPLDEDHRHFATFTHRGSSNFAVWSQDAYGEDIDLVVNEIGRYQGARPLDFRATPSTLRVEGDGSWRIVVRVLEKAPVWPSVSAGKEPVVLQVRPGTIDDPATAKVTHKGRSNFAVHAYGETTDLLVNEIGRYSGEVRISGDTVAIAIEGDGSWTMKPS